MQEIKFSVSDDSPTRIKTKKKQAQKEITSQTDWYLVILS